MTENPDDDAPPTDGTVLSPDELDITNEDNVVELDEGRYVISPGNSRPNVTDTSPTSSGSISSDSDTESRVSGLSEELVHEWLAERFETADSKYGFDVTARFEGSVSQRSLLSNDVVATFEHLAVWYANNVGSETPVEDVLGILLLESNLSVRFPSDSLKQFAVSHGLSGDDTLEELFSAARNAGGVRFPPEEG